MDNIVDFTPAGQDRNSEPATPDYHLYAIKLQQPDGSVEVVEVTGYLIVTGAFVGVCKGAYSQSEFRFMAPMERVISANAIRPDKIAGKLLDS